MILGLRLGNTNTSAFILGANDIEPRLVTFENGEPLLPTAVGLLDDGRCLVGRQALLLQEHKPDNAATALLRTPLQPILLRGSPCSPRELLAQIAKEVLRQARCLVDEDITRCVLSLPAYFNLAQIDELRVAVTLAGLPTPDTVSEPLAAALGANLHDATRAALVVRIGGTACDVAHIAHSSPWTVRAIDGDQCLGGESIDRAIADWFLSRQDSAIAERIQENKGFRLHVLRAAERAKKQLSISQSAIVDLMIPGCQICSCNLSRQDYERLARPEFDRVCHIVERCLGKSSETVNIRRDDFDSFLLTGGCAHIPALKRTLEEHFAVEFLVPDAPELISARGAALFGKSQSLACTAGLTGATSQIVKLPPSGAHLRDEHIKCIDPPLRRVDDNVQFTVFRPQVVAPQKWFPMLAFAHLSEHRPDAAPEEPEPIQEIQRQAKQALGEQLRDYRSVSHDSTESVPMAGELTFIPEVPGIEFNPARVTFLWLESVHRQDFRLRAATELDGQTARGRLTVFSVVAFSPTCLWPFVSIAKPTVGPTRQR